MSEQRLQKVIAAAGRASRRQAEKLIAAGLVRVNGRLVTQLGTRVDPDRDRVEVDGRELHGSSRVIYLVMNKPRSVLTAASDPRGRTTVMDLLGEAGKPWGPDRVFHVGRLDYHSEGLLILTNDGGLSQALTHPANRVPRTYECRVSGRPDRRDMKRMEQGVQLEDGVVEMLDVRVLRSNPRSTWLEITLAEGRNRVVRRLFDALGHRVGRLRRVSFGGVQLGDLPIGAVRELSAAELDSLRRWMPEA